MLAVMARGICRVRLILLMSRTVGQVAGLINQRDDQSNERSLHRRKRGRLVRRRSQRERWICLSIASGGLNLTQLSSGPTYQTSYSGSISAVAVPEPSSLAMSALGGLGALGLAFRKRFIALIIYESTRPCGILAMTVLAGSAVTTFAQSSLVLNLGPLSGSQIVFSGNSFNFSAATPAVGIGPKARF